MAFVATVAAQEIEFQKHRNLDAELNRMREDVIRADLYTIRSCIDQHFAEKGHYPDGLHTLVDNGYLTAIPVDPYTGIDEGTWEEVFSEPSELEDEYASGNQVIDIRYADDNRVALDGTLICQW